MPIELTDSEVVSRTLTDIDQFALIIDRYEQKLFRYIMRLGDFSTAE